MAAPTPPPTTDGPDWFCTCSHEWRGRWIDDSVAVDVTTCFAEADDCRRELTKNVIPGTRKILTDSARRDACTRIVGDEPAATLGGTWKPSKSASMWTVRNACLLAGPASGTTTEMDGTLCGDGKVEGTEHCDGGPACSNVCTYEPNHCEPVLGVGCHAGNACARAQNGAEQFECRPVTNKDAEPAGGKCYAAYDCQDGLECSKRDRKNWNETGTCQPMCRVGSSDCTCDVAFPSAPAPTSEWGICRGW